jgi:hypothetical protein
MDNSPNSHAPGSRPERWTADDDDVLESKPFGVREVRWSKSVGAQMVHRTSVNRAFDDYTPIFTLFGPEVYETQPTELYIALEQLPLETASNEALRAYALFREIVVGEITIQAHTAMLDALDDD